MPVICPDLVAFVARCPGRPAGWLINALSFTGQMTPKLMAYIAAGKALDTDDREIAALALQQVDESDKAAIDDAWGEEIDQRLDELMSGEAELSKRYSAIEDGRIGDEFVDGAEAAADLILQWPDAP